MKVRLTDNSRLHFDWTRGGALRIQLYQLGCDRHGMLLTASKLLSGSELDDFLQALQQPTDR